MWTRLLLLLSLWLLAACSTPAPPPTYATPTFVTPTYVTPSEVAYGTDTAWAQLTVALNERALKTFSLVRERAADTRLVSLSAELETSHTQENAQLQALLRHIGAPLENPHTSHDMPGMATAEEVASMSAARGPAFDKLFADSLRKHLTQCQNLAQSMLQAGRLPDALALAAAIESAREQAIARLTSQS
jgi:uncharacterized protein (DUF305 family)